MENTLQNIRYSYLQINTLLWRETETRYLESKNQEYASKRREHGGASMDQLERLKNDIITKRANQEN